MVLLAREIFDNFFNLLKIQNLNIPLLQVGQTIPEQKEPTPFMIEWIPDILPFMKIGELRIKFEYGHQRNGQLEQRISVPAIGQLPEGLYHHM